MVSGTELKVVRAYGGIKVAVSQRQVQQCHILCATLGRLFGLMKHKYLSLSMLKYLVIDEADQFFLCPKKEVELIENFLKDDDLPPVCLSLIKAYTN